jgi:hypothetical protein
MRYDQERMYSDRILVALTDAELDDLAFDHFCSAALGSREERDRLESACQAILEEYRRRGLKTITEGLLTARHEDLRMNPLLPFESASPYVM